MYKFLLAKFQSHFFFFNVGLKLKQIKFQFRRHADFKLKVEVTANLRTEEPTGATLVRSFLVETFDRIYLIEVFENIFIVMSCGNNGTKVLLNN